MGVARVSAVLGEERASLGNNFLACGRSVGRLPDAEQVRNASSCPRCGSAPGDSKTRFEPLAASSKLLPQNKGRVLKNRFSFPGYREEEKKRDQPKIRTMRQGNTECANFLAWSLVASW